MNLLVVGAGGQLGGAVVATACDRGHDVTGTYHTTEPPLDCPLVQLDVTDHSAVESVVADTEPDAVVNCTAMTDVDGCESDPAQAHAVNADAVGHLASVVADHDADFLHTSTDYVFDGTGGTPYPEDADPNPVQVYGESKLAGERQAREAHPGALVARLSFVYGRSRPAGDLTGFPAWVRDTVAGGETVPLFTDQHVTPTRTGSAAETFLDLLDADASGIVNVACRSCVTPADFGRELLAVLGLPERVDPGAMADLDRPAERPAYTCLDVSRVESILGRPQPTLAEDVSTLVEEADLSPE
jgi:dTDP-4-dehydrorhamnose reductase